MNDTLQEFCDSRGVAVRVDRQAGVIRGVKILGLQSRNGRSYLPEALARAAGLYEEAKVNVNHPKGNPNGPRDYQDRIGVIRNVAARPGEGLFADFHFNPKHALAEQLAWDAEHAPENVGFSHNVQAQTRRQGDCLVVEAITKVQSVDLVADPATTRGLFESSGGDAAGSGADVAGEEDGPGADDAAVEADSPIAGGTAAEGDSPIFAARKLGQSPARESGQSPARELGQSPRPDLTIDELKRDYPALVEDVLREQAGELSRLRAEVERLEALAAIHEKQLLARRLLRECNLPDPDAADPQARSIVSDRFLESLLAAEGEQAMRELVRERAELVRNLGGAGPLRTGLDGRPQSRDQHLLSACSKLDTKAFVEAIT
jgi:hypothetical protein